MRPETVWRIASRWQGKRTPPGCAHCADSSTKSLTISRSTISRCDRVGRPSPHTGQALIVALREHSGPFGRPECESWADRPLFARDRALRRSSIAHGSGEWPRTEKKTVTPPDSWVTRCRGLPSPNRDRRAAPCPARLGADRAVPGAGGRRRPVGRRRTYGTSRARH